MKPVFIIAIVAVAMIGVMVPSAFAEISYPTIEYRLNELPTYCIIDPENFWANERMTYTTLAERAVAEWDRALQYSGVENQKNWKIYSKIISLGDDQNDCTIMVYFDETVRTEQSPLRIGYFSSYSESIHIGVENFSEDRITNILLHEIGHSFGLFHYLSDDPERNHDWHTGLKPSPSIMVEISISNTELQYIEDVDIQKILSIYGSQGFLAYSPELPELPSPPSTNPIIPTYPIFPFDNIQIKNDVILNKYESTYTKITGQIKESEFFKGHQVIITIKKSDGALDVHKITPTKLGYFELPITFDKNSPIGYYTVIASYLDHIDTSMDFTFLVDFKNNSSTINDPKTNPQNNELFVTANTMEGSDAKITVTGQVANVIPGNIPITVTVMSPMASLVTIDQINVANDGSFETTMSTAGNLWKYDGTYTIKANYGSLDTHYDIELIDNLAILTCGSSKVLIHDTCVPYDITSGDVISATINNDENSIILNIDADDDGVLIISPSTSIQRGIFMVLIDGEQVMDDGGFYSATISGNTVIVAFPGGTEQIEIVGTYVVPEFGTIAAMILVVAIISIVAISAKSRLSIVPRY
jgi:predicted secreted protein with PEFG-CTERM motif